MGRFVSMVACIGLLTAVMAPTASDAAESMPKPSAPEQRGCCSHHGGVCACAGGSTKCCDGSLSPSCTCKAE